MTTRVLRFQVRVSSGRPFTHMSGEQGFEHAYESPQGRGIVRTIPRGRSVHIEYVGPENVSPGQVGNTEGPANVREIMRQLAPHYPEAEFVTGKRFGGANPGSRVVRGIPGRGETPGKLKRRPLHFAARRPILPPDEFLMHAAAVMDNPLDDTGMMSLRDHLLERYGDHPVAEAFSKWMNGEPWKDSDLMKILKNSKYRAYFSAPEEEAARGGRYIELHVPRFDDEASRLTPVYRRYFGSPLWEQRAFRANADRPSSLGSTRSIRRRGLSTLEVAHLLHQQDGPVSLLHAVMASRFMHPEKHIDNFGGSIQSENIKMRRRYAKVDGHEPAHPLVAGFPLEIFLRHLANDPTNTSVVRDLAKVAVTGGPKGDGTSGALWALHDALQESDHPLQGSYNLMSAADKIHLDAHTYRALQEEGDRSKYYEGTSATNGDQWRFTPEAHATHAMLAMDPNKGGNPNYPPHLYREALLDRVRNRVKALAPGTPDKLVDESIRRHAWRSLKIWRNNQGLHDDDPRDLGPYVKRKYPAGIKRPHLEANELATRYRRPLRFAAAEYDTAHLLEPQSENKRIGDEDKKDCGDGIHHYSSKQGSHRFVKHVDGKPVSAIQIMSRDGKTGMVVGAYTHGDHRRKGHARDLFHKARETFSELTFDKDRSDAGEVWVKGVEKKRRRYALNARGDFIDSLRRIRSSNQSAIRQSAQAVAQKLGLHPIHMIDALHDTPHGSTPGIAQAVYGFHRPEDVHAAAAWYALTANAPGVAVFHPRPMGPDALYRFRQAGSGLDLRAKMDRHGLTNRILVPHEHGFDVLIPDKGRRLLNAVRGYARTHGVQLQMSPGHFQVIGSQDRAKARDTFRNKIVQTERMKRGPRRMARDSNRDPLIRALAQNSIRNESTPSLAFADHLEETQTPGAHIVRASVTGGKHRHNDDWENIGPHDTDQNWAETESGFSGTERQVGTASDPGEWKLIVRRGTQGRYYVKTYHYASPSERVFRSTMHGHIAHGDQELGQLISDFPTDVIERVAAAMSGVRPRRPRHRYALMIDEDTMKRNQETLRAKVRVRKRESNASRREFINSLPPEQLAHLVVARLQSHGSMNRAQLTRATGLLWDRLDKSVSHAARQGWISIDQKGGRHREATVHSLTPEGQKMRPILPSTAPIRAPLSDISRRRQEGYTSQEIGDEFNVSDSAVRQRISRAKV